MGRAGFVLALALTVAGCAGGDETAATASARRFVTTAGTPLYAVVKGAACVVTAVSALPAVALVNVTPVFEPEDKADLSERTYRTVGRTCGGPYALGAG